MKSKLLIAGALLAVVIAAAGVYYYFLSSPGETRPTVENYFSALCENNIDKATSYMMFTRNYQGKVIADMENNSKLCSDNGGFSRVKLTEEKIESNKAKIKGSVFYKNGTHTPIDMQLMRVGEEWKIILQ